MPDSSAIAIRFTRAIKPIAPSAKFQTRSAETTEPTKTATTASTR